MRRSMGGMSALCPIDGREQGALRIALELPAALGPAVTERQCRSSAHTPRRFGTIISRRPSGVSTRQISRSSGPTRSPGLQAMHGEQPVDAVVRQRQQLVLLDQHRELRPDGHTSAPGPASAHHAQGLAAERARYRAGVAQPHQLSPAQRTPAGADAVRQHAARRLPEGRRVEVSPSSVLHRACLSLRWRRRPVPCADDARFFCPLDIALLRLGRELRWAPPLKRYRRAHAQPPGHQFPCL